MFNLFNRTASVPVQDVASHVLESGTGFIDVRTKEEYRAGHAKGARNIPLDDVVERAEELKTYERVYIICQSGGRSARAVDALSALDVNAINVPGGTIAWKYARLPME
jgi:rhodanese-related sulfurtransferase